jgi:hypothetical protein
MRGMRRRASLAVVLGAITIGSLAGSAQGAVTIGSTLSATPAISVCPAVDCTATNVALVPATVASGGLTSPVNGTVTSWSFRSTGAAAGDPIRLRVLRGVTTAVFPTATGAGASGAVPDASGVVGPNPTSVAIGAGDSVGLDFNSAVVAANTPSARMADWIAPPLADGSTRDSSNTFSNTELLVQATVEPTNTVAFGTAVRNKKKGTATVTMTVPNAGTLSYGGFGVKIVGPASAAAPGDFQLIVKVTGKRRKKLTRKGKASAAFNVGFTPAGGRFGATNELLTLRKKLKK